MTLLAIACRQENILAIAQWVEDQREWLLGKVTVRAVNGDGSLPKQASFYRFFWALEEQIETVEARLYEWAKAALKVLGKDDEPFRFSIDGNYLRGSSRKGERALLLLSAFVQELGLSLWQGAVAKSVKSAAMP